MRLSDLRGKQVAMWGGGVEGEATARAIAGIATRIWIAIDDKNEAEPKPTEDILVKFGEPGIESLLAADVVIKSPGIPPHHPLLQRLLSLNIPVITSTELWLADHASSTIGITGTKGKSTTTSILTHLMQALGFSVGMGGNVGVPLLSLPTDKQWYVAELSSYQCASLQQSPHIAVFTSLFPEHLLWHGSLEAYYQAKLNLAAHNPRIVIANSENDELRNRLPKVTSGVAVTWVPNGKIQVTEDAIMFDGQVLLQAADVQLLGRHNLVNIALCLEVLMQLNVDITQKTETIRHAMRAFKPLAHRLQLVSDKRGIRWVNDSLSTAPQSAIAALEIFRDERAVSIILGGNDRGISYEPLRDYFMQRKNPVQIFTIPDSGDHIAGVIGNVPPHITYPCASLKAAVEQAAELTNSGGVVLLSPAAPSFGRFMDYKDRGEQFTAAVQMLSDDDL